MAQGARHAFHGPTVGFSAALRSYRREAGLTQEELARRSGVGVRTVRELERGRVLRPQRGTVGLLAQALELTGTRLDAFVAAARQEAPVESAPLGVAAAPDSTPTDSAARDAGAIEAATGDAPTAWPAAGTRPMAAVPARPDLVGRDSEVQQLCAILSQGTRVVTLTGLAGVGKTCLALAVVHRCAGAFPAGTTGLSISDGLRRDDVLAAVASVFEVTRAVDLIERYAEAPGLLLMDSADRSPRAAVEAIRWLRSRVPALTILVTSRHPLRVPGEVHRGVEPLDVPERADDLAALRRYPAVALFLTRLHEVRPEPPTEPDAPVLAELVRVLGGLPLALELAAARGRVLELPELLERYRDRVLDLGTVAPEGQTLRDALAASYRLLEPADQWALRRLSVFRGRWSLRLAEELLADDRGADPSTALAGEGVGQDVEAVVDRLVGLGLVNLRSSGVLRFRLLDMVRDFAAEQRAAHGETMAARRWHARVLAGLAERTASDLAGPTMSQAVTLLDGLAADIRGALAFAATHDPHTALRLAAAIPRWSRFRGRDREARAILRRLLADPRTADARPVLRAWGGLGAAMLAAEHGAGPTELPAAEDALAVFRAAGDVVGELAARATLCWLWQVAGGYSHARQHAEAALALAARSGRARDAAVAQRYLTWHDIRAGDLAAARTRLDRAAQRAAEAGDERLGVLIRASRAEVARLDGAYADAVQLGRSALDGLAAYGDPGHRIRALGTIGRALAESGYLVEAKTIVAELDGYGTASVSIRAMIGGYIAVGEGDRALAAARFSAALEGFVGRHDVRDVLEALVALAAATDDEELRTGVLARIEVARERGQITLLPRDEVKLRVAAAPPSPAPGALR